MEDLCKKKIRKERLLKLLMPCVAAAVGLLVVYTHAVPQIPDSLRPYVGFGIAAVAAAWFLIMAAVLGSKARTTFCKRVLHYGSPRDLDELLVQIDRDMEAPAYQGGGTSVGSEWIVGGYYFPKVLSFDNFPPSSSSACQTANAWNTGCGCWMMTKEWFPF